MTVGELIVRLQSLPYHLEVTVEADDAYFAGDGVFCTLLTDVDRCSCERRGVFREQDPVGREHVLLR